MGEADRTDLENRLKIEAILFNSSKPVDKARLIKDLKIKSEEKLAEIIHDLMNTYSSYNSAIEIVEYADSVSMVLKKIFLPDDIINQFPEDNILNGKEKEVLSFIAFFQPINKTEIVKTFGKRINPVLNSLIDKGFIARNEDRFSTTELFSKYFNTPNNPEEIQKRFSGI